ncbi:MAG: hypothetical protein ACO294_09520 [Methylococcales bacterium]
MIKSDTIRLFELILQDEFKLKSRINLSKTKVLRFDGDSCMGMYEGYKISNKKFNHRIRFATSEVKTDEDLFSTLAHEYVHAWQLENDKELDHDTKSGFTAWRNYFMTNYNSDIVSFGRA